MVSQSSITSGHTKSASIPMGLTQQLEADAVLNTGQTVRGDH
uniref:Uncharacterized protein n=1 Tax=Vibrio parahaemolyticus TaxID=670 RepID=A0A1Y1BHK1_VIBPH|nr:hypothetical protein [Vibrio parahaemolyticus]